MCLKISFWNHFISVFHVPFHVHLEWHWRAHVLPDRASLWPFSLCKDFIAVRITAFPMRSSSNPHWNQWSSSTYLVGIGFYCYFYRWSCSTDSDTCSLSETTKTLLGEAAVLSLNTINSIILTEEIQPNQLLCSTKQLSSFHCKQLSQWTLQKYNK